MKSSAAATFAALRYEEARAMPVGSPDRLPALIQLEQALIREIRMGNTAGLLVRGILYLVRSGELFRFTSFRSGQNGYFASSAWLRPRWDEHEKQRNLNCDRTVTPAAIEAAKAEIRGSWSEETERTRRVERGKVAARDRGNRLLLHRDMWGRRCVPRLEVGDEFGVSRESED